MLRKYFCLILLLISFVSIHSKPVTIPALKQWSYKIGEYTFNDQARVLIDEANYSDLIEVAQTFSADIKSMKGVEINIINNSNPINSDIFLSIDANLDYLGDEGYTLDISDHIIIKANSAKGVFYGTRTLLQLLKNSNTIKAGTAIDYPSYPERG